jgi:AcrR family transcriptional regulator
MSEQQAGYKRGRARKEAILSAALTAFATRGYRGSSMAVIAEQVGLSEPGLLHHFRTKQQLMIALLEMREEELGARGAWDPGRESLADHLTGVLVPNLRTPHVGQLFLTLAAESIDGDHPAHDWFVERYRRVRRALRDTLERAAGEGLLDPEADRDELADQLIAMADGLQLQWLLDRGNVDLLGRFRSFATRLLTK